MLRDMAAGPLEKKSFLLQESVFSLIPSIIVITVHSFCLLADTALELSQTKVGVNNSTVPHGS